MSKENSKIRRRLDTNSSSQMLTFKPFNDSSGMNIEPHIFNKNLLIKRIDLNKHSMPVWPIECWNKIEFIEARISVVFVDNPLIIQSQTIQMADNREMDECTSLLRWLIYHFISSCIFSLAFAECSHSTFKTRTTNGKAPSMRIFTHLLTIHSRCSSHC